jgi:nitroreductase
MRTSERISRRTVLHATMLAFALPAPAAGERTSCFADLLGRRRMVRRFKPDPIPTATIRRLVGAAVRAPSAGHTQPWEFVVVRDRKRRLALAEAALGQTFVAEAPIVIVPCFDVARVRPRYGERAERYGMIDAAFASLTLLLAVADAGLGACFVGAMDDARVASVVQLPSHVRPLAVVPVGHPDEAPSRMRLRRPRDVVHFERWQGRA